MFANTTLLKEVRDFDSRKKYRGKEPVFNMRCTLFEEYKVFIGEPYELVIKNITSGKIQAWKVVISKGRVLIWANEVIDASGSGEVITEKKMLTIATCDVKDIAYIKLLPKNQKTSFYDPVQETYIDERGRRIEFGISVGENLMYCGQFWSSDRVLFYDFVKAIMDARGLPQKIAQNFDWNGRKCQTINLK